MQQLQSPPPLILRFANRSDHLSIKKKKTRVMELDRLEEASEGGPRTANRVRKVNSDGSLTWSARGISNTEGKVYLDLTGLGEGETYRLHSRSPADTASLYKMDLNDLGQHRFVVGSAPISVTVSTSEGQAVANKQVTIYQNTDSGWKWYARRNTNGSGQFTLELPNLGESEYRLGVNTQDGMVYSDNITNHSEVFFILQ